MLKSPNGQNLRKWHEKMKTNPISFDLTKDLEAAQEQARKSIRQKFTDLLTDYIRAIFVNPRSELETQYAKQKHGEDAGFAFRQLQAKLTEIALDPKWDEYIERNADRIYQEELDKAIRVHAEHLARKAVFTRDAKKDKQNA